MNGLAPPRGGELASGTQGRDFIVIRDYWPKPAAHGSYKNPTIQKGAMT